jgi:hypothetical protein
MFKNIQKRFENIEKMSENIKKMFENMKKRFEIFEKNVLKCRDDDNQTFSMFAPDSKTENDS